MEEKMRRFKQLLSYEEDVDILKRNTSGVLGVLDQQGYPYTVPLSYVYVNHSLLFHSAIKGHKIDSIEKNQKASFCVIDQDRVIPEKYTTAYRSVIAFGKISIVADEKKKRKYIDLLAKKYRPGFEEERKKEIEMTWDHFVILKMDIEKLTGKQGKELMNR